MPKPVAKNGKAAPESAAVAAAASSSSAQLRAATQDSLRALMLIRSYRVRGHLAASRPTRADGAREQRRA